MEEVRNSFNTKFRPEGKDQRSSYQLRPNLALPSNMVPLIQVKTVKGLRIIKIVKQIKFKGTWDELATKKCLERQ